MVLMYDVQVTFSKIEQKPYLCNAFHTIRTDLQEIVQTYRLLGGRKK